MNYLPLPDNAARQIIDSMTIFAEHRRVQAEAKKFVGGMYWKRQGEYEYLVKTAADNRQRRLGPRTAETERTYPAFTQREQETDLRQAEIVQALLDEGLLVPEHRGPPVTHRLTAVRR